ncbi:uncharacterized protein BDCG_09437 [Blastomyces dermatitidis ER-3]|uniref:Uncharacterized protein n=1 Tax=Ajellomyces dermatitidis (strain ER-3 / ATCC MYA-2586) TaxID=559297 RepID=A0ABP2ETR3_AJEDR|nr:uncharacterized protein BDCG_09437 [Blastomyces dermatitidis ER-3]EEQ86168.2 hypothetical protein BDCG_09437 [Blastomyces dermatitidis ER-3]
MPPSDSGPRVAKFASPFEIYPRSWNFLQISGVALNVAGLVAIAEVSVLAKRTTLLDILVLCPGIHRQQSATELHNGEAPAVAALTSGHVFRVENPATVLFLQKMGVTGHLTYLKVTPTLETNTKLSRTLTLTSFSFSSVPYFLYPITSLAVLVVLIIARDWWGLRPARISFRSPLQCARHPPTKAICSFSLAKIAGLDFRARWNGLKAVTSGQWLRDCSFLEDSATAFATLLVYTDVALVSNVSKSGQILILALFVFSTTLLASANAMTSELHMHGRRISAMEKSIKYDRRLDMANDLIRETKRDDWALLSASLKTRQQARRTTQFVYDDVHDSPIARGGGSIITGSSRRDGTVVRCHWYDPPRFLQSLAISLCNWVSPECFIAFNGLTRLSPSFNQFYSCE